MIATIGSLVQETAGRLRWLIATALYTVSCVGASVALGAFLAAIGYVLRGEPCSALGCLWHPSPPIGGEFGALALGGLATLYALSDLGVVPMPRPHITYAVPFWWWRRWGPFRASLAYGAALGLGFTTRIRFGSFYVLCLAAVLSGHIGYGAVLMGTYGAARALMLIPSSCHVYGSHAANIDARLQSYLALLRPAQTVVAGVLFAFGVYMMLTALV